MSLLIYSPRCKHSMDVIEYINKHQQLKQLVNYHNVNTQGIPPNYRNKINRVPTYMNKPKMTEWSAKAPSLPNFTPNTFQTCFSTKSIKGYEDNTKNTIAAYTET